VRIHQDVGDLQVRTAAQKGITSGITSASIAI
jgi:hypothetical protein